MLKQLFFMSVTVSALFAFAEENDLKAQYNGITGAQIRETSRAQQQVSQEQEAAAIAKHEITVLVARDSLATELGQQIIEATPIKVVITENSYPTLSKSKELFGDNWIKLADQTICYIRYIYASRQEYLYAPTRMATCKTADNKLIKKGFERNGKVIKRASLLGATEADLFQYDAFGVSCSYKKSQCELGQEAYLPSMLKFFNSAEEIISGGKI